MQTPSHQHPQQLVQHLQPAIWAKVNRLLLRKAIAEFSHELLLAPQLQQQQGDWGSYRLPIPDGSGEYTFRARVL
ncbi:IucA/IucC family siderophore biosynthesis protein, partial [Pseudomonas sp. MWU12-2534b]